MTGPVIDRAYIEILPSTAKLMPAIKADVDKAMNGIKSSVSNASKDISSNAAKAGAGIGTGAKAGAAAAAGHLTGLQSTAKNVFGKIKDAGTEAFGALGGGKIAGLLAVGGIIEFGKKSIATFEGVVSGSLKMQRIMGGTVQSASMWAGGMKLAGISTDAFAMAAKKMSQTIVAAGASPGSGPFHDLGINVRDARGQLKSMDQLLPIMADKFKAMPAGATKTALAVKIFGRTGLEMLPMLNRGSAGLELLRKKAVELGIVIGDKQVAAFKKSVVAQREFQAHLTGLQVVVGEHLVPVMDFFLELLSNYLFPALGKIGQALATTGEAFKKFAGWVADNKTAIMIVAGVITTLLLPALIKMAVQSAISIGQTILLWAMYKAEAVADAARVVWAALVTSGSMVKMAAQAAVSIGQTIALWAMYAAEAVVNAVKAAGAWLIVQAAEIRANIQAGVTIGEMIALWALMARQALVNAAKVAAAWLIAAGPIGLVVAGIAALGVGLAVVGAKLGWFGDQATKAALGGVKSLKDHMKETGGVFDDAGKKILANTLVQGGWVDKAAKAGITAEQLAHGVEGTDEEFKNLTDTWRKQGKPSNDTIFNLKRIHDGLNDATDAGKKHADQTQQQTKQTDQLNQALGVQSSQLQDDLDALKENNITVQQATQKYNDAVKEAHSFTAELGYMQTALDKLSNNTINATLGQLHLTDAWDVAHDANSALAQQVKQHSHSLEENTADGRSNKEWLLSQILAINDQAVSYAKSSGSIKVGTDSLESNKQKLIEAAREAGFNNQQVQNMINTYETTPGKIQTSIEQQGAQAVVDKLGEMEQLFHRIARPDWAANVDFLANNTSMPLGGVAPSSQAEGGPVPEGGRGPRADDMLIRASTGEYVVNAVAYAQNKSIIEAINAGAKFDRSVLGYAAGGMVYDPRRVGNTGAAGVFNLSMLGNPAGPKLPGDMNIKFNDRMPPVALIEGTYKAAFTSAARAAYQKWLSTQVRSFPSGVPGGGAVSADVAAEQAFALSMFRFWGWPASELSSLISLWNEESGWNPGATNASSGAYGIPQAWPAEQMASAGADWRTNPATQIRWGLTYIAGRYGTPSAAWAFETSHQPNWYGDGLLPTVFNRPTLLGVGERGPERVSVTPERGHRGGRGQEEPMLVRLDEYSIRSIASHVVQMDGQTVARLVSKWQRLYEAKGARV